jgi:pimeloyl-ACP methyl ester carboxylesterase
MATLAIHHVNAGFDTLRLRGRTIEYVKTSLADKKDNALILVHGSPGSIDAMLSFMTDTSLLARADLIAYDRPGFGNSGFGSSVPSLSRQADILYALMDSLDYKQYWLMGHSYGAPVLLLAAIRHPQRVAGICFVAGSISPELEPQSVSWRKWIDLPFVREILPISMRVSNEELMPLRQDLIMLEDDWDRIDMPVSIIHGTKDVLVPFENLAYAQEKLTNADTVFTKVFEKESHFILWTHEREIVEELVKLMDYKKK